MTSPLNAFSRRDILLLALSSAAVTVVPGLANAAVIDLTPTSATVLFSAMLADFSEEILQLSPTSATSLGLDSGPRSALKSRLADRSHVGEAKWTSQVKSMLTRMATVARTTLNAGDQIRFDTVHHAAAMGVLGTQFFFGGAESGFNGGTSPYPVSQQDGALTSVPEFLDSQHQIRNAADAQAYLDRVEALARVLDQETAHIAEQAGRGVMPPSFIARTALDQLRGFRQRPVATQTLVKSIAERTRKLGLSGEWGARAGKLLSGKIYPALDRQIAAFSKATANASDIAGVHRLPDGEAYYQWALRLGTTTNQSAAEVHALGVEQSRAIQSRMDTILRAQGMAQGTVAERMQALTQDPSRFFADDEQGRKELIAYCNDRVAAIRALMPKLSHLDLKAPLIIKRVPVDIQAGAALGYMNFASLDGSRPAIYYINLKSTNLWAKHELTTLTAHEGIPGHTWQGAYLAEHHSEIPLISSLMGFNAFVEGWALYAEQLCDEFGLYATDAFSQIGYLQAQQFRACRLVVDTGLHAMKWTRQQAIQYLVENTGRGVNSMTSEVDRYTVSPGQACGYKMGHNELLRQRERAKLTLGGKFDLASFNDALVKTGGVPLTVLATVVDQFIADTSKKIG
jgi:uncharacterized protein (DUF885 family)